MLMSEVSSQTYTSTELALLSRHLVTYGSVSVELMSEVDTRPTFSILVPRHDGQPAGYHEKQVDFHSRHVNLTRCRNSTHTVILNSSHAHYVQHLSSPPCYLGTYLLLTNKQPRHPHPRPNTHTRQQHLLPRPPQLTQPRDNLPRARRTKRMSQRNSATPRVHLLPREVELVAAVHGHAGEGLVDLDDVDVVEGKVVLREELGDGDGGADAHDARGEAGDGGGDVFGDDGLVEADGGGALHKEEGGSWRGNGG